MTLNNLFDVYSDFVLQYNELILDVPMILE